MKKVLAIIPARAGSKGVKIKILSHLMVSLYYYIQLKKQKNQIKLIKLLFQLTQLKSLIYQIHGVEVPFIRPKNYQQTQV